MPKVLDINGVPTWSDDFGAGAEHVVLLHGGFGDSDLLLQAFAKLGDSYRVSAFDRRGHGRTPDTDAAFHYDDMATETITYLETTGGVAHLVGFSDGGIISLIVAQRRPDLVARMVLIGTNFHYSALLGTNSFTEGSDVMNMIRDGYSANSVMGADYFGTFAGKTLGMFSSEPTMTTSDIVAIRQPTLVMVGDDDVVELGHTVELYESLPNGQLAVVPRASHLLPVEHPELCVQTIRDFLASAFEVTTFMPARRG